MILTALGLEYRAVREYLVEVEEARHETGTVFEVGTLAGTSWRVALVEAGEGNRSAAVVTEQARQLFSPDALLFVGVAGALKDDVALGDVVVATRVVAFHGGKIAAGDFLPRPEVWSGPHALLQTARHALRDEVWHERPDARLRVFFKPIAAGDVVLNSPRSLLREQLHKHFNDVVAIEMESAGMAHAAQIGGMEALTIRGISDRADGTKCADDDAERQPRAAAHAAAAAVAILRHHHRPPAPPPSGTPGPSTRRPPRGRASWLTRFLASPKVRGAAAGVGVFALLLGSAHYAGYLPNAGASGGDQGQATDTPGDYSTAPSQSGDTDEPRRPSPTTSPPPSPAPDTSTSQDAPTPSPSLSSSTPSPSPPPPADPPRPRPRPTAPTVQVRWQGTLSLSSNGAPMGWWLDETPPTRALIGDLGLECDCHPGEIVATAIAAWEGPQQPRYQQCSEMSGQLARRALTVQVGSMACLRTQNGRLGYVTVTSMPGPSQLNVEATVWDRG
ncbi:5'-methylthioadenosine/S-adenosylhomocysteine nucleosidase [Streptomyces sp. LX-29]|uniref:5'-methylthioadenosine/S-adenosylhomocysteine nucleosidase n=1 Tax=Streptomyces sp. LX-29 TaxID=2900152 RepID=UPI00240D851E|nr:5'-methylthioadenosine/S-adenosylhomocysteine nucleosidase [Streptomyces sp. LX-29]WFB10595.1 5'-methylthioadenosine/S-adenosylhomocysteine nucleosidase [Streptomyces sp. LX-29]